MAKTKLEELVVELAVENKALVTQLKASQGETNKAMQSMQKSIQGFAKESNSNISSFQRVFETAIGFVGGQAVLEAFGRAKDAAIALFKSLVNEGVAAAQVQEDAIQKLNTQLALNGQYSRASSQEMQDFASDLQKVTKIGDETTLQMLAMASTFGKSNEETKKLTLAAIELSAATGMSLEGSIKNLGKTYAGMTGELGESLPIIRSLTAEQLKNGEALDLILKRFGGSAAAQVNTFSGSIDQLKNSYGDMTEEVGFVITQNDAVINVIKELNSIINDTTEGLHNNSTAYKTLVAEGIVALIEGIHGTAIAINLTTQSIDYLGAQFAKNISSMGYSVTTFFGLLDTKKGEEFRKVWEEAAKGIDEAFQNGETFNTIEESLIRLKLAAREGADAIRSGMESTIEPTNAAKQAIVELSEEQKKNAELGRELAVNAILAMEEDNAVKNELQAEQYAIEQEQLQAALDQKLISERQYHTAKRAMEEKRAKDEQKLREEEEAKAHMLRQQRLSSVATMFGGLAALAKQGGRETFMIAKRLAQAQAITDGVRAVQAALANPPGPPWSIATAVGVGAMAAANVAQIERTQFAKGGTVPGIGFQDTVPAMLTPKEEVIDRSTSKMLREFLTAAQGGGPGSEITFRHLFEFINFDGFVEVIESKIIERRGMGTSLLQGSF